MSLHNPRQSLTLEDLTKMHYLGDALIHMSFPLLLWSTPAWHPLLLLGPLTNYRFLRKLGGDIENEASQEEGYKEAGDAQKLQDHKHTERRRTAFGRCRGK